MTTKSHPEYFELIKKHFSFDGNHLDIEFIPNPPSEYIKYFFSELQKHDRYEELKNDFLYDKEHDVFLQVHNRIPVAEIENLDKQAIFFYPFMTIDEINRILNIKSAEDYLLALRAEQVENNIRLKRTFSKLRKKNPEEWSFTNYFESSQYSAYLKKLKPEHRIKCINIPHGTIHSSEANGTCIKSPHGNIIVLSYSLRYFLYYMNVFHFGGHLKIKSKDIFQSFLIAMRIMLGTETLDFEIDSRGDLPEELHKKIEFMTDWQMNFIIGHEYAHHYLDHLDINTALNSHLLIHDIKKPAQIYTYRQEQEFEADRHAVSETIYNRFEKTELIDGGFLFFSYLEMYSKIVDYMFPSTHGIKTHPEPIDRIWKLREAIDNKNGLTKEQLGTIIENNNLFMKEFITNFLPYNIETIEKLGSIYLPSYKTKYLVDRLDI